MPVEKECMRVRASAFHVNGMSTQRANKQHTGRSRRGDEPRLTQQHEGDAWQAPGAPWALEVQQYGPFEVQNHQQRPYRLKARRQCPTERPQQPVARLLAPRSGFRPTAGVVPLSAESRQTLEFSPPPAQRCTGLSDRMELKGRTEVSAGTELLGEGIVPRNVSAKRGGIVRAGTAVSRRDVSGRDKTVGAGTELSGRDGRIQTGRNCRGWDGTVRPGTNLSGRDGRIRTGRNCQGWDGTIGRGRSVRRPHAVNT